MTVCLLVVFALLQAAAAATIRGELVRRAANGANYPAGGIAVTIYNQYRGRSTASFTAANGMYYIYNIPAGAYYLEIWTSRDPRVPPTVYPVQIREPYTDIPVLAVP